MGAKGANRSTGAGAAPLGLAAPPGFSTSTYLLLGPETTETQTANLQIAFKEAEYYQTFMTSSQELSAQKIHPVLSLSVWQFRDFSYK